MSNADVLTHDPLAAILNDPETANRHARQQRARDLFDRRRRQLKALDDAFAERFQEMHRDCPELGRPPTQDEHFGCWAGRLKRWGDAVRGCGCRARNALRGWQPPNGLEAQMLREARFAHLIAYRAADPNYSAAELERDLRRACTTLNAHLLETLFLPSGWLGRIHDNLHGATTAPWRKPRGPQAAATAGAPAAPLSGPTPSPSPVIPAAAAPPPPNGQTRGAAANRRASINARMLETIQQNPDAMGWSCKQWARHLKCAKSSVVETETWKNVAVTRDRDRAERRRDRRRRPNASHRGRD